MSEQTYSLEELRILLTSGGELHRINGQLFIVQQTGLVIGPLYVEPSSKLLQRNSLKEITMSGENYKNPLLIKAPNGISVSDIEVVDRNTVTFKVTAAADATRSGHSLEFLTRPNDDESAFDSSSVTIQNNVVVIPASPVLDSPSPSITGEPAGYDFHEIGQGEAESEHGSGKVQPITGENFFDMQDIEDELQGGQSLAEIGIIGAATAGAPEADGLRCRFGTYDPGSGEWQDHPDVTVVRQAAIAGSESQFDVTISIDSGLTISDFQDEMTLDCLIETRSGGLASDKDLDSRSSVCLSDKEGDYAIVQDYVTVRRAKVHEVESITEVNGNDIDVAAVQGGDASSLTAALAAGSAFNSNSADFGMKQSQTRWIVVEAASPFANPDCVDESIEVARDAAGTTTSPQMGVLNTAARLDAHAGWSTTAAGSDELHVLSPTQFLMKLVSRSDQALGTYAFRAKTLSNGQAQSDALFSIDLAAAEFVLTGFDILQIAPDALQLCKGSMAVAISGSGMPDGFGVPGHPNEAGAIEGSLQVVHIQSADQLPRGGSQVRYQLDASSLQVQDDVSATLTIEASVADAQDWISDGGSLDDVLGFYDVRLRSTDVDGNAQEKDLPATLRLMHKWPPEFVSTDHSSNYVREASAGGAFSTEDDIDLKLIRLRGDDDANAANTNGISRHDEYQEHELELYMKIGNTGDPAADNYVCSTEDQAELLASGDNLGTDKPFLLVKRIEAGAAGEVANDSEGIEQSVYDWKLVVECVAEEALLRGLHTADGLGDLVRDAGYYGNNPEPARLGVRARTKDFEEGNEWTGWQYFDDIFEVLPANLEVDALSAAQAAAEVARAETVDVSMGGDNLYPDGDGDAGNAGGGGGGGGGGAPSYANLIDAGAYVALGSGTGIRFNMTLAEADNILAQITAATGGGAMAVLLEDGDTPGTDPEVFASLGNMTSTVDGLEIENVNMSEVSNWAGAADLYMKSV